MHHRSYFEKYGGFDENLNRLVDWDLLLRYTYKIESNNISSVNITTVNYWRNKKLLGNISSTRDFNKAVIYILNKLSLTK